MYMHDVDSIFFLLVLDIEKRMQVKLQHQQYDWCFFFRFGMSVQKRKSNHNINNNVYLTRKKSEQPVYIQFFITFLLDISSFFSKKITRENRKKKWTNSVKIIYASCFFFTLLFARPVNSIHWKYYLVCEEQLKVRNILNAFSTKLWQR